MWDFRVNATGQLRLQVNGGGINSGTKVNTGQWVHVAVVLPSGGDNADDLQLYVNGVRETGATITVRAISTVADADLRIGDNNAGGRFTGLIDDVRVYDRGLSAEEIALLANP